MGNGTAGTGQGDKGWSVHVATEKCVKERELLFLNNQEQEHSVRAVRACVALSSSPGLHSLYGSRREAYFTLLSTIIYAPNFGRWAHG